MSRLIDLKEEYNEVVDKLNSLKEEGNIEEVKEHLAKAKGLKEEIETLEEVRNLEIQEILNGGENMSVNKEYNDKILQKLLLNKATEEEKEIYNAYTIGQKEGTPSKGGYLVPETQITELYEYKRTLTDLSQYINVINVSTPKGKMPLEVLATQKLSNLTEGEEIPKSEVTFGQTEWATSDYGDLMRVTNQLLQDSTINIMGYLKTRIGKKVVNTVNEKIISILKTLENPIEATKTQGLEKLDEAIIKGLDPAFRYDGIILTNQSGRLYLETLTDNQGRPLLSDSYTKPGVKEFRGLTLVEVSDELLPNEATNKASFFVGDMKALITMFDLRSLELAVGEGFENYTTLLRAIVRFDIKKIDKDAMKWVKIATA